MISKFFHSFCLVAVLLNFPLSAFGSRLDNAEQKILDAEKKEAQGLAQNPELVRLVDEYNRNKPKELVDMTQDKWSEAGQSSPVIIGLQSNKAAELLRKGMTKKVSEMFVSGADGTKVAFLKKTSNWSHAGKDKHEVPMKGETWQGEVERDASVGVRQVQFALPIFKEGKPIGSLVVGIALTNLK